MKTRAICGGSVVGLLVFCTAQMFGSVIVTEPSGGQNLSADKAVNSTNGSGFSSLGDIVLTEGATTDFEAGNNQTLILTTPDGWRLNPGVGTVIFQGSRNITAASIAVTASNATVTFSVSGTTKADILTVSGLQAQSLDGLINDFADTHIRRLAANPGTAVIAGIENDFTVLATLTQVAGVARALDIRTQPALVATVGIPFVPQPEVEVVDQFGNLRNLDSSTVVTAARVSGTGTLQGNLTRTAAFGIASYTNLSLSVTSTITIRFTATSLVSVTSGPVVVGTPQADRLVFTTQPAGAVAGTSFGTQPALRTRDVLGSNSTVGLPASQLVTIALTSGTGTLLGTTTLDIGTNAGNGVVTFTDLQLNAAGTGKQLTASSAGLLSANSGNFTVNTGAFTKLQLLAPGETAAPDTASGKTGSPSAQSATIPFNVTVNAADVYWNLVTNVTHTVGIISSDAQATLPANAALVAGTKNFSVTLKSLGDWTVTATDITDGTRTPGTSPAITVNSGPASKLTIQTQPSGTGAAGVAFAQQPVIRVEDAAGNLVSTDNGRVITAARGSGTGTLQGTLTASTVNGVATFANLSYNVAETITLNFTASGLTNSTSSNIVVSAATADRLVFTTQPGGVSRLGSVLATQPVLKSRDQFGNNSTVGLSANLSVNLALTSGSGSLLGATSFDIGTAAGNGTVAFTNLQCTAAGTNKQVTATASGLISATSAAFNIGGVTPASGGGAISADTAGGTFTSLSGPTYFEAASGDAGTGTIILNPPTGFIFDTNTPAPQVIITRLTGTNANTDNLNDVASGTAAAVTSRATNQITFTVAAPSSNGVTCSLTWTNLRVRPLSGAVLTNGNLTKSGTATMAVVTAGSTSFGALTEVPGLATRLAFTMQPGAAMAGAPFGVQPVVRTRDQFGNNSTNGLAAGKIVLLSLTSGVGPLLGTTNLDLGTAAGNGVGNFTGLQLNAAATNDQLTATSPGSTNAVSSVFTNSAAAASKLMIQTQPSASATAGTAFAQQPVIRIEDAFGNLRSTDNSTVVTVTRATGSGTLLGTTSRTVVNGVVTFTNLSYNIAETITLSFASSGLVGATSSNVGVNPAAANRLTILTQPSPAAMAGLAFAQQPVVRIEDAFGNLRSADNSTVVTAARAAGSGTLQGTTNVIAANGLVTFANLAHNVATNITITFSSGSLSNVTSTTIAVSPAAASKLTLQTQPSSTATTGVAFAQQPAVRVEDAFGNLLNTDSSTVVIASRSAGSGALQGNVSLTAVNGLVTFTNLSHNVATNITIQLASGVLTSTTSSAIAVSPAAAHHLTIQIQPSTSATAGIVFAQQPVIRIEDVFGNLRSSDNVSVVTASRSAGSGTLLGTTSGTAAGGVVTFTNLSYSVAETITLGFASGALPEATSSNVVVSPAVASKLTILTQPSPAAIAGVVFAQQPVVRIEDQFGNLRNADSSTVVTAARSAGGGTLQGTTNVTAVGGVVAFANLSHLLANNITIQFSSGSLNNATSANVAVSAGAFTKLQVLVPGETAAAGTISGKTGAPNIQFPGTSFNVTVNAMDDNWNLVNSVTDVIAISSSDTNATLPASTALVGGTKQFPVALQTAGTVTASDVADNSKSPGTSANIPVNARLAAATGGGGISADTVGGSYTTLTGPSYSEFVSGEVGTGTIQLVAPSGFIFATNTPTPTVLITRLGGSGGNTNNINDVASGAAAAMTSVTTTQMTFTVTGASAPGVTCSLTWQNVRVRPTIGAPLAVTNLTKGGTAVLAGVTNGTSNCGTLREIAGAANRLTLLAQPSATATAGVAFTQQPVVCVKDQFGNTRNATNGNADNATLVTATRVAGSGVLQGATNVTAADGLIAFTNLAHLVATNITISFSSGSLVSTTSTSIAVSPAAASQLVFTTQPANGTVGAALGTQPALRTFDAFGNRSTAGLGASRWVTLALSVGTGALTGTNALDIGTSAGNGVVSFTNLGVDSAGTNKQLTASAGGLSAAVSSVFSVGQGSQTITFGALANKTYGDAPVSLSATASSGLPVNFSVVSGPASVAGSTLAIAGAGTVTVRASQPGDANWTAATQVDRAFTAAKAVLTISADNQTRTYGAPNPALTASFIGLVNVDTTAVLSGSVNLSTTATPTSPVAGSPYPITVTQGTLASTNYTFNFTNGTLAVTKATLTLTADDKTRGYGAANPPLTHSCSGFANGESTNVLSGNPVLSTAATSGSPVAGGPYPITISLGTLVTSNYDCIFVNGALTLTKSPLTVTAVDQTREYGAPDPTFTATYSGFVNGENETVFSGSLQFTTVATSTSSVAGNPYAISVGRGTLGTPNYSLSFVPGELTITPASLASVVTSSANPSPTGSNVTFTATLTAAAPSSGVPTGQVQFTADGSPLGSTVALSGGAANLTTASLSHGIHTITTEFASDGNFYGITNSLNASEVIDAAPLAAPATYLRSSNSWVKIPIADLLTNYTSDADNDPVSVVSLGTGTNGATILLFGDGIYYLPSNSAANANAPDHFNYSITDGFAGCLVTNQVCVRTDSPSTNAPPPAHIVSLSIQTNGVKITFAGTMGYTYHIERRSSLGGSGEVWEDLGSVATDDKGIGEFTDAAMAGRAFYRVIWTLNP